jgi:hypothetical protein
MQTGAGQMRMSCGMDGGLLPMIALVNAVLCVDCLTVCDATVIRGEVCPKCAAQSTLLSLGRVLRQQPELGAITFILSEGNA